MHSLSCCLLHLSSPCLSHDHTTTHPCTAPHIIFTFLPAPFPHLPIPHTCFIPPWTPHFPVPLPCILYISYFIAFLTLHSSQHFIRRKSHASFANIPQLSCSLLAPYISHMSSPPAILLCPFSLRSRIERQHF